MKNSLLKVVIKTPRKNDPKWQLNLIASRGGTRIARNRLQDIILALRKKALASSKQSPQGFYLEVDYGLRHDCNGHRVRFNNTSYPTSITMLISHIKIFTEVTDQEGN